MEAAEARLFDPRLVPFSRMRGIGIAIKAIGNDQRHVGILYRYDESTDIRLLELAWHYDLRARSADESFLWTEPIVELENAENVGRLCIVLARKYSHAKHGIAYALRYTGDYVFDGSGNVVAADDHGLTCATFVLAVLASRGIILLRLSDWQPRDEDYLWQKNIVDHLRNGQCDTCHITAIEEEVGCTRFRPEEVAAAGVATSLPIDFEYGANVGRMIIDRLAGRTQ